MKIIVLAYHHISPKSHISPEIFEWQIKKLKEKFIPLTLDEVDLFLKGKLNLEKDGFVITLDDGYKDNLTYAYPILKKQNIKATIFVIPQIINEKLNSVEFLNWQEIKLMSPFIQAESHSYSHGSRPGIDPTGKESRENWLILSVLEIEKEIKNSTDEIMANTKHISRHLAWPYGEYKKEWIVLAKEAGLDTCMTTRQGWINRGDDPYELKRFSPPRNKILFLVATRGKLGMTIYILILKIISTLKKTI